MQASPETPRNEGVSADGAAYERFVGRWSRLVARVFLDWLAVSADCDSTLGVERASSLNR